MSIKIEQVSYCYDQGTPEEYRVLRDVNVVINPGERIGLIGHTGSGKSTLIQIMNGLLKPTTGTVWLNGEDINAKGYDQRKLRSHVGLVFQYPEYQLFADTVFEDVCFGPRNLGWSKEKVENSARKALLQLGIEPELFCVSPFSLSGGQQRRVAIAGVFAMNPSVLILDEPTAGLDPGTRKDLLEQILKHGENGGTVILVSHSMEDVADYVNRILVMNEGTILLDGPAKEIFAKPEKLERIGLAAPQIAYVMQELHKRGFSVRTNVTTLEEAKQELLRELQEVCIPGFDDTLLTSLPCNEKLKQKKQ